MSYVSCASLDSLGPQGQPTKLRGDASQKLALPLGDESVGVPAPLSSLSHGLGNDSGCTLALVDGEGASTSSLSLSRACARRPFPEPFRPRAINPDQFVNDRRGSFHGAAHPFKISQHVVIDESNVYE